MRIDLDGRPDHVGGALLAAWTSRHRTRDKFV
jgi:hypothetical protein